MKFSTLFPMLIGASLNATIALGAQAQQMRKPPTNGLKNDRPADFSGSWVHTSTFEYENQQHIMDWQLHLVQRGNRVCGCAIRAGVGGRYSFHMVSGRAIRDVLDIFLDAGDRSVSPDEYDPTYPFVAYLFDRFQRRGDTLWIGSGVPDLAAQAKVSLPSVEKTQFFDTTTHRRRSREIEPESCDYLPKKWAEFRAACFADTDQTQLK